MWGGLPQIKDAVPAPIWGARVEMLLAVFLSVLLAPNGLRFVRRLAESSFVLHDTRIVEWHDR